MNQLDLFVGKKPRQIPSIGLPGSAMLPRCGDSFWYLVMLPSTDEARIKVQGYNEIHKIGWTHAGSQESAVSRYLHRQSLKNDNIQPKLIYSCLDKEYKGVERFACALPRIEAEDGSHVAEDERTSWQVHEFAIALAPYRSKRPEELLGFAGYHVGKLREWLAQRSMSAIPIE